MFDSDPVIRLSRQTTSSPRSSSRSQRCEPRKPAPPVTTTRATSGPTDALIDEPAAQEGGAIHQVAGVDHPLGGHGLADLAGVPPLEPGPRGEDGEDLGAGTGGVGVGGDLDAVEAGIA